MKTQPSPLSIARPRVSPGFVLGGGAVSLAATLLLLSAAGVAPFHAPRLHLLAQEPPQVAVHLGAALVALAVGLILMVRIKGSRTHRLLGWTWVAAMATTAVSSIFIRQIEPGQFSWIHLLTGWTIVALPGAVWAARRHRVAIHARAMTGLFVGGVIIAGAFTFFPGRLMWRMFFG